MKRVTGGTFPAQIWRSFMAASLPRLSVQPIPGGAPDDLGAAGEGGVSGGEVAAPPAAADGADGTGEPPPG